MTAHELITPAEYARRRGCTRAAVSKAIERCRIPLDADGRLDPLVADTLWAARTDLAQQQRALGQVLKTKLQPPAEGGMAEGGAPLGAPVQTYANPASTDWRRRREAAEAQLAELNLRKASGELVAWADVARELERRVVALEVLFQALPERAAAALGVDEAHRVRVRQFMRAELEQIQVAIAELDAGGPADEEVAA